MKELTINLFPFAGTIGACLYLSLGCLALSYMEKRTQAEKAFHAGMSFAFGLCSFLIYFAYKIPGFILTGHF